MSKFLNYVALGLVIAIGYLLIVGTPEGDEDAIIEAVADIAPDVAPVVVAGGDPVAGEAFYNRQCVACHSVAPKDHRVGPSMFGVVGRPAGQMADYPFSQAMQAQDYAWTAETLTRYLQDPVSAVPGTTMAYRGIRDADDLANVIAYLATLTAR